MSKPNFEIDFGPDIAAPVVTPETVPAAPAKRTGRPKKYATEAERKAARNERDRARRAAKAAKEGAAKEGAPRPSVQGTGGDGDLFANELKALREGYAKEPKDQGETDPANAPEAAAPAPPAVSGYLLLLAIDALAPLAVRLLFRRDASTLALTDKEKERLEPLADAAAGDLTRNLSPAQIFIGAIVSVYASKIPGLPKIERRKR